MRYMIEDFMDQIKQAGGFESLVKMSEKSGLFHSKPPDLDIPMKANNSRKICNNSPVVTMSNPRYSKQQSDSNCCDERKSLEDAFFRDYKQCKHEHPRSHYYRKDQQNVDRGKFHRDCPSIITEKHSSQSRSHEHSSHNKQDYYSNKKKQDNSSRIRDGWQKDTHRSHISDSFLNNAFSY